MQDNNSDITNTIAVLALIVAILGLIIDAVVPVLGPLGDLILVAFIGGGVTGVWADRRFTRCAK